MFCSRNVSDEAAAKLNTVLGIALTKKMGKYMSHHIVLNGKSRERHKELVQQIQSRAEGWKLKCFSRAGKFTLAQSVLASILIFHMQLERLPAWVHKELDMAIRSCVWGSSHGRRRIHLVGWEEMCKPKKCGGVNVKSSRDMNRSMLAKLAWEVLIYLGQIGMK